MKGVLKFVILVVATLAVLYWLAEDVVRGRPVGTMEV